MKKNKTILLSIFIFIIILISIFFISNAMLSNNYNLIKDRKKIENIINKKYQSYKIEDIKLTYTDWSSTTKEADEKHRATDAKVIIKNENEQITIYLEKKIFIWVISKAYPDYGPNIPDNIYFVEVNHQSVGQSVDIESYLKNSSKWIIPDDKGNLYKIIRNEEEWYYSFKHYDNIYKTKDGNVYKFNKEISNWELSNIKYSDLNYYSNYDKVDKEYVMGILEKYSNYKD